MTTEPDEKGWGFILLMGGLTMPVAAVLAWALLVGLNIVFGVAISLDWAFGIVMIAGLVAGPAVVASLVLRQRRPARNQERKEAPHGL